MQLTAVILASLLALCAAAAISLPQDKSNRRELDKRHEHGRFEFDRVHVKVNQGIYAFDFTQAGISIKQTFEFFASKDALLTVWDCYCSGDGFNYIYNNGYTVNTGSTNFGNATAVPCAFYSKNPEFCLSQALLNNEWLFGFTPLQPGAWNVTLAPFRSPFNEGTGFLRVDDQCYDSILMQPVPCCKFLGGCPFKVLN